MKITTVVIRSNLAKKTKEWNGRLPPMPAVEWIAENV
jgi:hypothetical protein